MSTKFLPVLCALAMAFAAAADDSFVIRVGERWHYLKTAGPAASPGSEWRQLSYDDSHWRSGLSGLVLPEDEDILPAALPAPTIKGRAFVRKTFTIPDPREIKHLVLRLEHEAGFVAYLNGVEIARHQGSGIRFPTPADVAAGMEGPEVIGMEADVTRFISLLVQGDNVLALEGPYTGETLSPFPISAALAANFTRGPFIQNTTTNSVQIIWRTANSASTFVEYGTTTALGSRVTNGEPVINHVVTLSGLAPDTLYFYRAGSATPSETLLASVETFRTFKTRGPLRFVLVGDTGQATAAQGQVAAVMRNARPDLVLHGGDILYAAPWTEVNADLRIFNYYQPQMRSTPFFFAIGNHDLGCCFPETVDLDIYNWHSNATNFQRTFYLPTNSVTGTEHFYSFDHGDAHFVGLYNPWFSAYVFTAASDQYLWLTNDLAASTKPWKFIFLHSPIAHSGAHASADRGTPLAPPNGILDQTEMMNLILPAAEKYGVQVVFGSHEHSFERFAPTNGMHHLVSGGGGANNSSYNLSIRHAATAQFRLVHHCLNVSVNDDTMRVEALGIDGKAIDSLVIQRALPSAQIHPAAWNTPVIETTAANDSDGNINGQTFDLIGTPILPRHGRFSNLGEVYVNNDESHLYIGVRQAMFYHNNNVFLFVQSPRFPGVTSLAGLGNGIVDPAGQSADGLDFLENLSFANFTPSIGCILGDEFADGQYRNFVRGNLALNIGQGIFRLDSEFSDVPGVRLQQFNRSPQAGLVANDSNADLIELAIPFAALGNLQPGDVIKVGAVVGGSVFDTATQSRFLDTAALGTSLSGSGLGSVVLEGVSVRLAFPPSLDTDGDGLADTWELAHGLNPYSGQGDDAAAGDPDHDGFTNSQEQMAGTDPRDAQSVLRLSLVPIDAQRSLISWRAVLGKKYQLEYANEQPAGFASFVGGGWPRVAASEEEVYEDILSLPSLSSRFYRVKLVP